MIKSIDKSSVHRITSGQVLVDLQTAVKELVENSLDAGATSVDVKFKEYGTKSFEVSDNGSGISPNDYEGVAMKHWTSKLEKFEDLTSVESFGFRGEALSSLCALSERVTITTATSEEAPIGTVLEFDRQGRLSSHAKKAARPRGTTVSVEGLFAPLPVRHKEFLRNSKREFGKALTLLSAYALVPCSKENRGVRLSITNILDKGRKSDQLRTDGKPSLSASISALWGPKQIDSLCELHLDIQVSPEKSALKRQSDVDGSPIPIKIRGYVSKFSPGFGRASADRQFYYVNGRPCALPKIQKAFNEIYRSFNANQSPLVVADFILPTYALDVNVSPDKRMILLHNETAIVEALKGALEDSFGDSRGTFAVQPALSQRTQRTKSSESSRSANDIPTGATQQDPIVVASNGLEELQSASSDVCQTSPSGVARDVEQASVHNEPTETSVPSIIDISAPSSLSKRPRHVVLSDDRVEEPIPFAPPARSKPNREREKRPVQMVLNTSNAVWNMQTPLSDDGPVLKKRKTGDDRSKSSFRSQISAYASQTGGSKRDAIEVDGDDDEEQNEENLYSSGEDEPISVPDDDIVCEGSDTSPVDVTPIASMDTVTSLDENGSVLNSETPLFLPEANGPSISVPHADISSDPLFEKSASDDGSQLGLSRPLQEPEIDRTVNFEYSVDVQIDLDHLTAQWSNLASDGSYLNTDHNKTEKKHGIAESAGLSNTDEESAGRELSRVIKKTDFAHMDIVGQFNLGFIIVRRKLDDGDGSVLDDLFIVDQHAADEKYNFETLQQTTKIESQKLLRPRPLEMTASEELLAIDNIEMLKHNGFELFVDEDADRTEGRVKLVAHPVSKSTTFDMKDLEELIHLMQDRPSGQMVRCSKARAMFAMRACRKSFMIGMPLNKAQMVSIVRHMGTMDQPWNCPHGRPTMRHLVTLDSCGSVLRGSREEKRKTVNWLELEGQEFE